MLSYSEFYTIIYIDYSTSTCISYMYTLEGLAYAQLYSKYCMCECAYTNQVRQS